MQNLPFVQQRTAASSKGIRRFPAKSGPRVIVTLTMRRQIVSILIVRNVASSYSEEPGEEILCHGKARLRNATVLGWLCRPPGIPARPRPISSLRRARARPGRQCVWSPHVRDHALLGRRPARVGRGGTRLRGGVAKPTEVGRVALVEVSRPQRHAGPE